MYSNGASSINSTYQLNEMENCRLTMSDCNDSDFNKVEFKDDNDESFGEENSASFDDSIDDEDDCFVFESKSPREK